MLLTLPRRSFLRFLGGAVAAPLVCKAANLELVRGIVLSPEPEILPRLDSAYVSLGWAQIEQEAIRLFRNNNEFLQNIEGDFSRPARICSTLRIRLPLVYAHVVKLYEYVDASELTAA